LEAGLKPLLFDFVAVGVAFAGALLLGAGFVAVFAAGFDADDALLLLLTRLGALNGSFFFVPSDAGRLDAMDCDKSGKSRSVYFILAT
jgi:hypothetical protein